MAENKIVEIALNSKRGEREFLDRFVLEIDPGCIIRLTAEDISAAIFIPDADNFFENVEQNFIEHTIEMGESITLPPLRSDLEPGRIKEYQVYNRTYNHFAWRIGSSPPKIVIR